MPMADVFAIVSYWSDVPPAHLSLARIAAFLGGAPSKSSKPSKAKQPTRQSTPEEILAFQQRVDQFQGR